MLTNAVVISVLVLTVLCWIRGHVFLALLIASVTAGVAGGLGLEGTMTT